MLRLATQHSPLNTCLRVVMKLADPRLTQGLATLIAAMACGSSWQWGLQPIVRSYRADQARMIQLKTRIAQYDTLLQAAGGQEAWLARHRERLAHVQARLPDQAQLPQLLNTLVDALKRSDLTLVDVTQDRVEMVGGSVKPLLIQGAICYRLPVTIEMEGRYQVLLSAMERLTQEDFPALVSIDQGSLHLKESAGSKLRASIRLSVYVTGGQTDVEPHA